MSTVVDAQGTLDGMPVVESTSHVDEAVRLALSGTLLQQATVRTPHGGDIVKLEVLFQQHLEHHPRALPVLAVMTVPDLGCYDRTLSAAMAKVVLMREGADVLALGRGLELARHVGMDVFRLIHVDGIDLTSNHP